MGSTPFEQVTTCSPIRSHNFGDALTAVPLRIAFLMRSERAERTAGLAVVAAIFISACVGRRRGRSAPHPPPCAWASGRARRGRRSRVCRQLDRRSCRTRAGQRLDSPALIDDGAHARADAYVSLAVIGSAIVVALGLRAGDPIIGLAITLVILRITWQSWRTVRGHDLTDPRSAGQAA